MQLTQKKFLLPKSVFTIREHVLHVKRSTLTSSSSVEVPFIDIDPLPSEQESLALGWYIIGSLMLAAGLAFAGSSFGEMPTDSRMGLWLGALLAGLPGVLCLVEARKRTFAFIIFHSAQTGNGWIYIRQKCPSELHVKEFVEILKEKIQSERDDLKKEKV